MTPEQYVALAAELLSGHPVTGAYDADNQLAADQINAVNRTRIKPIVSGSEVANSTDNTEFTALVAADQDRWLSLCGIESLDTTGGIAGSLEAELFGSGSSTRANLIALRTENISRAVELDFGFITAGQIEKARGG